MLSKDLAFEFMLNALRLVEGFEMQWFEERTGMGRETLDRPLGLALARDLMLRSDDRWMPTPLGQRFLNDLQAMFLPA